MNRILFLLPLILTLLVSGIVEAKKKIYSNGNIYEGEWKKGVPNGLGKMIYANGNIYEGNWISGIIEGKGKMTYANGDIYEGTWKMSTPNGFGKMTHKNGDWYEGEWYNGRFYNGSCKGYVTDSLWCEGNLQNGKIIDGKCKGYMNENYYDGQWKDGAFIGNCKLKSVNKDIVSFEGTISADTIMHGCTIYSDGSKFNGTLKNYKKNKQGNLSLNNITVYGNWNYDTLISGWGTIKFVSNGENISFTINKTENSYDVQMRNRFGRLLNETSPTSSITINELFKRLNNVSQKLLSQTLEDEKRAMGQQRQEYIAQKTNSFNIHNYMWSVSDINRLKQQNIAKFNQTLKGEKVLLYGTITDFFTGEGDNTAAAYWSNGLLPSTYTQYFIELQGGIIVQAHSYEIEKLNRGETIYVIADLRKNDYHGYVFDARNEILTISLPEMKKKLCEPLGDGVQPDFEYEIMKLVKNIYR
ncbi:MORN repeat-containing protein [Bacteroides clarus]|uniref:MORN repeat protein n=1 Tax=Bacteroides clarus TaxID=626929 RepID=A0A1Y3Z179_9BACE|nr:hypothetical protein [Bacteroides clarus]OUO01360.1 hypothetical protein B5F97_06775 [Bacteroides clarus]